MKNKNTEAALTLQKLLSRYPFYVQALIMTSLKPCKYHSISFIICFACDQVEKASAKTKLSRCKA